MAAPVNVKLDVPTIAIAGWADEAAEWEALNRSIGAHPEFYPLTIKAAYVVGVIHDLCVCVTCLLQCQAAKQSTYIPAVGVCAAGIELLGRCIRGNSTRYESVQDPKMGFKWLLGSNDESLPDTSMVVQTSAGGYDIERVTAMRHFAAHGQATSRVVAGQPQIGVAIDFELLEALRPLLRDGVERYWNELQGDAHLCNMLARANVLRFRDWPVFQSWTLFTGDPPGSFPPITEIFNRFNWTI